MRRVTHSTLNSRLLKTEYAVRGAIVLRAMEHAAALKSGSSTRPFDQVVYCNIGNPQSLQQKPITFNRQVLSLLTNPDLLADPPASYPADVLERAAGYLKDNPHGVGAYTESAGVAAVRRDVADFIERRDGFPSDPDNIFLTDGASPAVQMMLNAILRDEKDTVLVPLPQYPLYSASLALYGGTMQGYYLNEETNWGFDFDALKTALDEAEASGKVPRGLVVINPGNPTGGVLSEADQVKLVEFCVEHHLVLMADEVYQENIWADGAKFLSFKHVAAELGALKDPEDESGLQLASFHSVSKGFLGECGLRGGYVEACGFSDAVLGELYKRASVSLCPNAVGQYAVGLMVKPPEAGSPSFPLYDAEKTGILESLQRRAAKLSAAFTAMDGISCLPPQGALYIFPRLELPPKAVEAASASGVAPDAYYCTRLLDATGIVTVPGSGFGQVDGTYHFRTTILPPEEQVDLVVDLFGKFHADFMAEHA